ncbi:MAG TPA: dihydropteroate synthase [Methylomusa anaerophila]|uniref:Dihydropteroate synthase n=1 Tax=Methylomusa anaerophila TaxID=1930071 RepID=A0A348AQ55_9FIRM|nr:dihydropteroate synthase [Methylomusa anaerophila]BBB93203.1 dihydropteroate synthase [Methylomusa anaerophila]HML86965.1 dihydropteroate synthase [Methylomusa anaerophila]
MIYNPRIINIKTQEQARNELKKIKCEAAGANIMSAKATFKTIKVEKVQSKAANILKQTFLSKGGEASITRGAADFTLEYTDVLLSGTIKQYRQAISQLKMQPWGLAKLAAEIETVILATEEFPYREFSWEKCKLAIEPGHTLVMGILNITPDSFSDGGRYFSIDAALRHAEQMIEEGADILDIGAESTRPYGSEKVSAAEEMDRLLPVLEKVLDTFSIPVSVDTYKASVAGEALKAGAHIINDVWGLQYDPEMAKIVAQYDVPIVIMHNQNHVEYERDIMSHICEFLRYSIEIGTTAGIEPNRVIIDPGIGFGKKPADNLIVMSRLNELCSLGCPILLGSSRKRFIGETLGLPPDDRMEGTGATVALGISKGANIVRVHDVKAMVRIAKMTDAMINVAF